MTTPEQPQPHHIEILVDGKRTHTFTADRVTTREDRETLTLEASAWQPNWCTLPPNDVLPDLGVAAVLAGTKTPVVLDLTVAEIFSKSPFPGMCDPDPAALGRALALATASYDIVARAADLPPRRGTCPECAAGAHHCTAGACYCANPHRCNWTQTETTTEGTE